MATPIRVLIVEDCDDDAQTRDEPGAPDRRSEAGHPPLVLAVSGDRIARDLMTVILKRHGLGAEAAAPEAAIDRLRSGRFTAVLVDVRPQALVTREALLSLRCAADRLRFVILADECDAEARGWAREVRAPLIVARPFEGDALIRALRGTDGPVAEEKP